MFNPKPFSWVSAALPFGNQDYMLSAWFVGKDENGRFLVEFSDDSNALPVKEVFPQMTAEQRDDQRERTTGCRFDNLPHCKNPDCKHNGYQAQ